MPYTCELIMLDRDTCGMPAEACPYCSRPHYFCSQCFPEHIKIHQPRTEGSDELPDSFWIVDFMKFSKEGRPIEGTSWRWMGIVFNAKSALEKAVHAMIAEKPPEEGGSWRCVRVAMDLQAVLAVKSESK